MLYVLIRILEGLLVTGILFTFDFMIITVMVVAVVIWLGLVMEMI